MAACPDGEDLVPGMIAVVQTFGDEHAVRLSLRFDLGKLSAPTVALGNGAGATSLTTDETETPSGRIGINVVLPDGATLARGDSELVVLTFTAAPGVGGRTTAVSLGDAPTPRKVLDGAGSALTATFVDGDLTVLTARHVGLPRRRLRRAGP
jgi:hypothetical protein